MDTRNKIKSCIVREGITMIALMEKLAGQYDRSASVPNLSGKLRRDSLRYREAVELADARGMILFGRGESHITKSERQIVVLIEEVR